MKTRNLVLIALVLSLAPVFVSAQEYGQRIYGREGAIMESGLFWFNMLSGASDKKPAEKAVVAKQETKPAKKAETEKNTAKKFEAQYFYGREGKMMALGETLKSLKETADKQSNNNSDKRITTPADIAVRQAAKEQQAEFSKKYQAQVSYKKFLEEQLSKINPEQKARYDAFAKNKDFASMVKEVRYFKNTDKFNYDADKYYLLVAAVKVDGKGIISFGSLDVAQAILITTDSTSFAFKEAKKVEHSIHNAANPL